MFYITLTVVLDLGEISQWMVPLNYEITLAHKVLLIANTAPSQQTTKYVIFISKYEWHA